MRVTTKPIKNDSRFTLKKKYKRNSKHNNQMDSRYMDARYCFIKSQYWRIDDADVANVRP